MRLRFLGIIDELPQSEIARLTQIDYAREMVFIATASDEPGEPETLGVVRMITDPDNERVEFAVVVRSDFKGTGLGRTLMEKMIRYCRSLGTATMFDDILRYNSRMLKLAEQLGFVRGTVDEDMIEVTLTL